MIARYQLRLGLRQVERRPRRFGAKYFCTIVLILITAGAGATAMYCTQVRKPLDATVNENR